MLGAMARGVTGNGVPYDSTSLDPVERRFWRESWESVPDEVARLHRVELRDFGPIQASLAAALPTVGMVNLLLGATEPGAVEDGHLAAATRWAEELGVGCYVPLAPGAAGNETAERWLTANGYSRGYGWMKFVRDAHPPRFRVSGEAEVVELSTPEEAPFGMIAATGFGLPAWAAALFSELPGRSGWRCYAALLDGKPQACAAMLVDGTVAEFGIAATLEPARGRGCQLALLHRRIADAAAAGCETLFVETGERVENRPAGSYRNILRAGFEEAYLRPNWQLRR